MDCTCVMIASVWQFMQEMSVAWKITVDMRLGLFAVSADDSCSVPGCHVDDYQPTVIDIGPHNLWTRVSSVSFFNSSIACHSVLVVGQTRSYEICSQKHLGIVPYALLPKSNQIYLTTQIKAKQTDDKWKTTSNMHGNTVWWKMCWLGHRGRRPALIDAPRLHKHNRLTVRASIQ